MADLPTGTVTFLFTDIEGSTRLWSESREAMSATVERHDAIVRSAVEDHDGFVFATGGDAFSVVFRSAQDALAAAGTAQLLITGEDWGESPRLRVRMGVHTGEAEERDDNYFGPALSESARLMSAGQGRQILVSETAQRIAGDRLPDKVALVDLGEQRLKDLDRPIRVYLSEVALDRGDIAQAIRHLAASAEQVRPLIEEDETNLWNAGPLHSWAEVAVRQQRFAIAVTLLGAQSVLYEASPSIQYPTERAAAEDTLDKARAGLDAESFDRAWDDGTAMRGTEALDYAVDQLGSGAQPTGSA